jgi:hypothetical protein
LIRSSALLTAVAMVVLVVGVSAANLALIYVSIAVSILAAVTLAVGVLLRRRELLGEAGAAPQRDQPGWAAPKTARPVPVRPAADDRVTADRGGRREDTRRDGEQPGDLAARLRKAGSGAAADAGSARWPASIAAKGAPATARRDGEQTTGGGRVTRSPADRRPGRGDWAGRDRAGAGRDQGPATARPDREPAAPGRGRGERDRAAAARADRARTPPGRDRDQETPVRRDRDQESPARRDREQAGRGRGEAAAGQQAEAFRLPPQSERTRARAEELSRAVSGEPAGDDLRDRVSEEFADSGSQEPVRPAWSAAAGPRAMGTGSAARRAPGETADEPAEAGQPEPRQPEPRQPEPVPWAREAVSRPPVPPDDDAARAAATAEPVPSSGWSAWSSTRAGDQGPGAEAGETWRDSADQEAAHDEHAVMQATAGAAAVTETGTAGDRAAEAGAPGDAAVEETADRAGPGGVGPGEAERPGGTDDSGATGGSTAEPESEAGPGSAHDGADASKTAGAEDAGDAGESGAAGADADGSSSLDDQVTVVPGVPRYHRRGCILIRFLSDSDLETSTRRAAEAAGLVPCKACQPDIPV